MAGLMDLLIPSAYAYGTGEHKWMVDSACKLFLGDAILIKVNGISFTLGDITALAADYYATPGDLRSNATRARKFLDQNADKLEQLQPVGEFTSAIATGGTYISLATNNYSHFRLGTPTENAPRLCSRYHAQAILRGSRRDDALLYEGFALHFLTDLFAAGHMRTPRFAITQQLSRIPYPAENAAILGGLLAKAMHDEDNASGLKCVYTDLSDFVQGVKTRPVVATFKGDNALKRMKEAAKSSGPAAADAKLALSHLVRVIVWDVVTAVPSLVPMLASTVNGKELLSLLPTWKQAFKAPLSFEAHHAKFVDAVTPRPLGSPDNPSPLFYVKGGNVYASRPVSDAVIKGLYVRSNAGLINKAWLEVLQIDLNMTYISVNADVDFGAEVVVRTSPNQFRAYAQLRFHADLEVRPETVNVLDHGFVIDGDSPLVGKLFRNVILVAWNIRTSKDVIIEMKNDIAEGVSEAKDATVDALKRAKDAAAEGVEKLGEDLKQILENIDDVLVPPAY